MSYKKLHKLSNTHLIKRCFSFFIPYKWRVLGALVAGLIVAPTTALTLWLTKYVMDEVLIAKDMDTLKLCVFGIIALYTVEGIFRFIQTYTMNSTGLLVLNDIRNALYAKIVRLPTTYFAESEVGMLMSRILNDVAQIRMSLPSAVMLIRETLSALGLIAYAFYTDTFLAFWAVCILPAAIYPFIYFGKRMRKLGRRGQSQVSDVNVRLQESFSGIRVIKAFANERGESDKFSTDNKRLTRTLIKQVLASELASRVMEFITAIGGAVVLWYGGKYVIDGNMTPGELITFLGALAMIYQPIKKINMCNVNLQQALAGAERVFDIFDNPEILVEDGGTDILERDLQEVELDNVRFTYPGSESPALDGVNLTLKSGQRVAIVGPSGAGKSTLVSLLPRFYDPQEGQIRINGRQTTDYTLDSLRLNMGIVSQDTFLFNATIRDNIAYAYENVTQEDIEAAAKAAYAHDFISQMPEGYDTVVGERGVKISGGQKQRLTIARALLKNPPLLILDEATSALDTESERIVQMALENLMKDRTSIVIAHRLSTVLSADTIVVMEGGRVVDAGRHAELLESCTLYARLYEMQFEDNGSN